MLYRPNFVIVKCHKIKPLGGVSVTKIKHKVVHCFNSKIHVPYRILQVHTYFSNNSHLPYEIKKL
jgi:hypothetical protein